MESSGSLKQVEQFLDAHDDALKLIDANPKTAAIHPITGDQSWVFGDGRYRFFFRAVEKSVGVEIYLIHIIDNRRLNRDVYPENTIPTYEED